MAQPCSQVFAGIRRRGGRGEGDAGEDVGEVDFDLHGPEGGGGVEAGVGGGDQPTAVGLDDEGFDGRGGLGDEDVFLEGGDRAVVADLVAAVVGFGGGGEDFDDRAGVGDDVAFGV